MGLGMTSKAKKRKEKKARARAPRTAVACLATLDPHLARARAEAVAVSSGLRETARLEAERCGCPVQRAPDGGPLRLKTRDGLLSLLSSGSLSGELGQAGLAFRHCFEASQADLQSVLGNPNPGADRGERRHGDREPAALRRALILARLNQMERAVDAASRDGRELLALRLIAGEGRTLSSLASGGNAKVAYLAALVRALEAVRAVIPVRRGVANRGRLGS